VLRARATIAVWYVPTFVDEESNRSTLQQRGSKRMRMEEQKGERDGTRKRVDEVRNKGVDMW
jgi:hypothetical protein